MESWNGNGNVTTNPDAAAFDSLVNQAKSNSQKGDKDGKPPGGTDVKVTLYNNGLTVESGDGKDKEFKDLADPASKQFLDEMKKGYVPKELVAKYGRDLNAALEDRREEDYKKPYNPWEGKACSIGDSKP